MLAQCGGQTNREDSAKFANERAREFAVSLQGSGRQPPYFIFDRTAIDLLHGMGVTTVVHPTRKLLTTGGLKPDEERPEGRQRPPNGHDPGRIYGADGQEKAWRVFRHL